MTSEPAAADSGAATPPDARPAQLAPRARAPIVSDTLFGGAKEVQILHHGTLYRLKQTALGKLILTK